MKNYGSFDPKEGEMNKRPPITFYTYTDCRGEKIEINPPYDGADNAWYTIIEMNKIKFPNGEKLHDNVDSAIIPPYMHFAPYVTSRCQDWEPILKKDPATKHITIDGKCQPGGTGFFKNVNADAAYVFSEPNGDDIQMNLPKGIYKDFNNHIKTKRNMMSGASFRRRWYSKADGEYGWRGFVKSCCMGDRGKGVDSDTCGKFWKDDSGYACDAFWRDRCEKQVQDLENGKITDEQFDVRCACFRKAKLNMANPEAIKQQGGTPCDQVDPRCYDKDCITQGYKTKEMDNDASCVPCMICEQDVNQSGVNLDMTNVNVTQNCTLNHNTDDGSNNTDNNGTKDEDKDFWEELTTHEYFYYILAAFVFIILSILYLAFENDDEDEYYEYYDEYGNPY